MSDRAVLLQRCGSAGSPPISPRGVSITQGVVGNSMRHLQPWQMPQAHALMTQQQSPNSSSRSAMLQSAPYPASSKVCRRCSWCTLLTAHKPDCEPQSWDVEPCRSDASREPQRHNSGHVTWYDYSIVQCTGHTSTRVRQQLATLVCPAGIAAAAQPQRAPAVATTCSNWGTTSTLAYAIHGS